MKNKKNIYLVLLAAVLILLVLVFLIVKNLGNGQTQVTEPEEDTSVYIVPSCERADVIKIEYTNSGGTFFFERNDEGAWVYNSDEDFPLDQTKPNSMSATLCDFKAEKIIENGAEDEFGFDTPTVTLKASYKDGTTLDVTFGTANEFYDGNYYLKDNITSVVYLVKPVLIISFDMTEKNFISADTFPTDATAETITSMSVTDEVGNTAVISDYDGIYDLSDLFYGLAFSTDRAAYTGDEGTEAYGIGENSPSIKVNYKKEVTVNNGDTGGSKAYTDEEFVILFGNMYEGESGSAMYYYSTPTSKLAYSMTGETYENIMSFATYVYDETSDK